MNPAKQIHYITNNNINRKKWDACIEAAPNGLIYAYSWYLDPIAKHWDALVLNDYEAVMPLTWNKKWGFRYLYQPPITPQLGIFSGFQINEELVELFLAETRRHFRFAEIFLNYSNPCAGLRVHANYILPLSGNYEDLYKGYKKSLVKNLNRSAKLGLKYIKDFDLKAALDLYQRTYAARTPHVTPADYRRFGELCFSAQTLGNVLLRAAFDQEDRLLAVCMLLKKSNRMYLLESTTLPEGRIQEANHFLLNNLIMEFAGTTMVLDFDGSDIPGIAYYYQTFGSINQPYFFYRHNHLPWWIKWMKG
jgi:hypothetical protein